jgi:hypothetical protein
MKKYSTWFLIGLAVIGFASIVIWIRNDIKDKDAVKSKRDEAFNIRKRNINDSLQRSIGRCEACIDLYDKKNGVDLLDRFKEDSSELRSRATDCLKESNSDSEFEKAERSISRFNERRKKYCARRTTSVNTTTSSTVSCPTLKDEENLTASEQTMKGRRVSYKISLSNRESRMIEYGYLFVRISFQGKIIIDKMNLDKAKIENGSGQMTSWGTLFDDITGCNIVLMRNKKNSEPIQIYPQ